MSTECRKHQNNCILNYAFAIRLRQLCIQNTTYIQDRQQLELSVRLESTECSFTQMRDLPVRLLNPTDLESPTEWWMNVSGHDSVSTDRTSTFIYIKDWTWSHQAIHWQPPRTSYDICKLTASTNHIWLYTWPLVWTTGMSDLANASAWVIEQTTPGFVRLSRDDRRISPGWLQTMKTQEWPSTG